jgi:diadenosine tetraphosphatase ApaH/serine/threonine PP2A family protein phosphatase
LFLSNVVRGSQFLLVVFSRMYAGIPAEDTALIDFFYASFDSILAVPSERIGTIGDAEAMPIFSEQDLFDLCRISCSVLRDQHTLIELESSIHVIGDIHGSFHDLVRLLNHFGLASHYLFLGDYVDRGEFSIECIVLLLVLLCRFPGRFSLIRGNHELVEICSEYGFKQDVLTHYSEQLFEAFMDVFSYLPLAALVNNSIFCVHGGIGECITSLNDVGRLVRPITTDQDSMVVRTLLWADPVTQNVKYGLATRCDVPTYGRIAVREFLQQNNLKLILRGHQCVNGVQLTTGFPVITVFSASNYRHAPPNDAGVLWIDSHGKLERITFPPLPRMAREAASFYSPAQRTGNCSHARTMPTAALWHMACLGAKRSHRTSLGDNSVAALLAPRRIITPYIGHARRLPFVPHIPRESG